MKTVYPLLSFLEIEKYAQKLRPFLEGGRVERVFVPENKAHPEGFFKKEWVIDIHGARTSCQLFFSVRPQQSGLVLLRPKTLRPSSAATRSAFDLSLGKNLGGIKIQHVDSLKNERALRLIFDHGFHFYLMLIPTQPESVLLQGEDVLASTKLHEQFSLPPTRELTAEQIQKIPYREELFSSTVHYADLWFRAENAEALLLRKQKVERLLKSQIDSAQKKIKSLTEQLKQNEAEPDWNYYGSLLQTHFYSQPKARDGFYELLDYEKEISVKLPADPKLNLKQQLERYFHQAKRNKTRLEETTTRTQSFAQKVAALQAQLTRLQVAADLPALLEIEQSLGLNAAALPYGVKEQKKLAGFSGKQYRSKEGLTILAGRNITENAELTFKIAKGNDIWLHVKGRPGSHTVILLPPKRTASLDTLLDAAHVCILHSNGKDWGKTEVDYTARKHVKKIKNQTDVSYTHNKTLMVTLEQDRLDRLFKEE